MQDFGNGVSRTLSAIDRQFQVVVWQAEKPPLDAELNLIMQADWERLANAVRAVAPSGWLADPFNSDKDYQTTETWANFFKLGSDSPDSSPILWANVNGWVVPVTGTRSTGAANRLNLFPPPSTDARIDYVFLEVWLAQVAPNPSTINKPSASTIYRYGNVEFGGTNVADDLEDPATGYETTERVQLQYRIRVVGSGTGLGSSVDLATFPDGLDDPNVLAQGSAASPQVGFIWSNMRDTLGDPGLWRSGDGDPTNALSTVDGYVYAVPICGVFRRNSNNFSARVNGGNANQNGAMNRNPITAAITDPVEATRIFTQVALTSTIDEAATGSVQVDGLAGSGFDNLDIDWNSTFLVIDEEIIGISAASTSTTPGTITIRPTGRGRNATQARSHEAGAALKFYIYRPDGLTADMINPTDILDLRKAITLGEWDYQSLLTHNLGKLFGNSLRSSYKQAGGSDTQGPVVVGVDTLYANGAFAVPNQTGEMDGPDGIRRIFSDAATVEKTSILLAPTVSSPGNPVNVSDYTALAGAWGPAADYDPDGFQAVGDGWRNQSVIRLYIGSNSTNGGARQTVRTSSDNRFVRFVTPREYWLTRDESGAAGDPGLGVHGAQTPFQLRFIEEGWGNPAGDGEVLSAHPGPMWPVPEYNFERPFIVLGGTVNSLLRTSNAGVFIDGSVPSALSRVRFAGLDFNTGGGWYPAGDVDSLETMGVTNLLLHGQRNLFDMLTAGGTDRSGASSELYVVLTGDLVNTDNTGVFRVIGAGTAGYTRESGATAEDLVIERVGEGSAAVTTAANLTAEVRSQYTHTEDNSVSGDAAAVIVLTDLTSAAGGSSSPWNGLLSLPSESQAVLDASVLYGPSRGMTLRVPDRVNRVAWVSGVSDLVRDIPSDIDATFDNEAGIAEGEVLFADGNHIQLWSQLPSLGLSAPRAPAYGGGSYFGEERREAEVFVDPGSKTLLIQPYRRTDLTLVSYQAQSLAPFTRLFPEAYTVAGPSFGVAVDGDTPTIFAPNADYAFALPWEYMPRFGRQDIPYHIQDGTGQTVFPGINHLFGDSLVSGDNVFHVVGGPNNSSAVQSLFIQTGATGPAYGEFYSMGMDAEGYQGRIYTNVNVQASDVPRGLKGIQLPPFLGIARLYGVYDLREFSNEGAYENDRVTLSTAIGRPKNLLKTDSDKQTLYIVQGGAEDVTGNANDHTYVIPSDLIDVRLSGAYVPGEGFDDLNFVVECVIFGFGRGFINLNNYVMARRNLPTGGVDLGLTVGTVLPLVSCILPLPLSFNDQIYVAYDRTVYQGDPFMTRAGSSQTVSDYASRMGQIPQTSAFELATAIQQYDSSSGYSQVPEIPNARSLEILASADFFTTLGTGKIGGPIYPGTYLDVGHIANQAGAANRIPAASSDPIWQTSPRTFSASADAEAPRAIAVLNVLQDADAGSLGETIRFSRLDGSTDLTSGVSFTGATRAASAESLAAAINSDLQIRNLASVQAIYSGGTTVTLVSFLPGAQGGKTAVELGPKPGARVVAGFNLVPEGSLSSYGTNVTAANLQGGRDRPMNGSAVSGSPTPVRMAGLTERLPLGILLQDADFIGEDPLRDGTSALRVVASGGGAAPAEVAPVLGAEEFGRIQGAGQIGMADGGILEYTAASGAPPTGGTRSFRLYRGGGSSWVLDPSPEGGPVDWSSGSYPEGSEPVLKGAVLAGRAFLVRNWPETAYSGSVRRSWGDEIQMVVLTEGIVGLGPNCGTGYVLDGQISPTGYGEGMAASDRYRLEGKPMINGHSKVAIDPNVPLAPYPGMDEGDEDPCP